METISDTSGLKTCWIITKCLMFAGREYLRVVNQNQADLYVETRLFIVV